MVYLNNKPINPVIVLIISRARENTFSLNSPLPPLGAISHLPDVIAR